MYVFEFWSFRISLRIIPKSTGQNKKPWVIREALTPFYNTFENTFLKNEQPKTCSSVKTILRSKICRIDIL